MLKLKQLFSISAFVLLGAVSYSQTILISGQLGYYNPKGDLFTDKATDKELASFGIGGEFEALYFLPNMDEKIGVGIMTTSSIMIGEESENELEIGLYGLSLYGLKGQYRLSGMDKKVTPYGSLAIGLSKFETPDIKDEAGQIVVKGEGASAFGIRPEIGIDLGGFLISMAYFVPMNYSFTSDLGDFDGTAGAFSISIGYAAKFNRANASKNNFY